MKSLIAVVKSDRIYEQLQRYCDAASDISAKIQKSDTPLEDARPTVNGGADIVIVETEIVDEDSVGALEQLCKYVTRGGSFIVIADEPPISMVRRLFQAGVSDVLPRPVSEQELFSTLAKAAAERERETAPQLSGPAARGVILTVLKSAGGVGATTVAVNLAAEIRRRFGASVALADFDLQFGELHVALDLKPKMSVIETIEAGARLDATLLRATLVAHKSGVQLLASPPAITPLDAIDDAYLQNVLAMFRQEFDITIIEMPSGWTDWTRTVLVESDLIIPVLEPTVRSGAGAARIMRCCDDLEISKPPIFAVANKVVKGFSTNDRLDRLKEILGRKMDAVIRDDQATAAKASDVGAPLHEISANSLASKDVARMAEKVFARLGRQAFPPASERRKKRFSLRALRPDQE